MAADSAVADALIRIEHKVDLALRAIQALRMGATIDLKAVGDGGHTCPVCGVVPQYLIDTNNAIVVRKCACSTGKVAIDLKSLELPTLKRRSNHVGAEGTADSIEDRPDSGSSTGHTGKASTPRR